VVVGRVLEMLGSRGVSVKTVWPCVPRHRVTHLHPMPSRITRNSHRPRASDRTMVASEATISLAALSNSMASSPSAEKLTRMDNEPNFSREVKLQWAGCRETISFSGQGGAFFLTFLFIERFDRCFAIYPSMLQKSGGTSCRNPVERVPSGKPSHSPNPFFHSVLGESEA
jgi:hypothetical protein